MNPTINSRKNFGLLAQDRVLPLVRVEIEGEIIGLLHHARISQSFFNDHNMPLEAVYIHPLPPQAAVHGFQIRVGERLIDGRVKERGEARREYSEATQRGHRAALLEEERSDIFTTTVGNIAPGEEVTILFEISGPLEWLEDTAKLCLPLVVPEVYIPGQALGGWDVGLGVAADTNVVPDASRITPPRLSAGAGNPVELRLSYRIDPLGLEVEQVDSLCHFAKVEGDDLGCYQVSLVPGLEQMDKDFVLRVRLKRGGMQTTMVTDPSTKTFALTVVPPTLERKRMASRDVVFVVDRSGSMAGQSMPIARSAVAGMIDSLTAEDHFVVIAFDDTIEMSDPRLLPATLRNKESAFAFLRGIEARGGTEAQPALHKALRMFKGRDSGGKSVVFITDGAVGNDRELRSVTDVRINTVGIGQNVSSGVLQGIANATGGLHYSIPDLGTLTETLHTMHKRIGNPYWTDLQLEGAEVSSTAPRFWDVWEGVPTTFFGKLDSLENELIVSGAVNGGEVYQEKVVVHTRESSAIYRSWAKARLQDLETLWTLGEADSRELIELSVEAQVLCRFTAFSVVDLFEIVVDSHQQRTVVQPVRPTLRWGPNNMECTVKDISAQDFGNFEFEDESDYFTSLPDLIGELTCRYVAIAARQGASRIAFSWKMKAVMLEKESGWEELFQSGAGRLQFFLAELSLLDRRWFIVDVEEGSFRVEVQSTGGDELGECVLVLASLWEFVAETALGVKDSSQTERSAAIEEIKTVLEVYEQTLELPSTRWYKSRASALLLFEHGCSIIDQLQQEERFEQALAYLQLFASVANSLRFAIEILAEAKSRSTEEILIQPSGSIVKVCLKSWGTRDFDFEPGSLIETFEFLASDHRLLSKIDKRKMFLTTRPAVFQDGNGLKVRVVEVGPALQRELMPLSSANAEERKEILHRLLETFTEQAASLPDGHIAKELPRDLKAAIEKFEGSGDFTEAFRDMENAYGVVVA